MISLARRERGGGGGGGVFKKFAMTAPPSVWRLVTDIQNANVHCKYYFRYLSQIILARIVDD